MRIVVGLAALALLTAGCGSTTGSPSVDASQSPPSSDAATTAPSASAGAGEMDYVATVKQAVEVLLGQGSYEAPPTTAPAHEPGKTIAIIDSTAATAQAATTAATVEAAKALGWESIVYDVKLDPTSAGQYIQSAIARKVDAITIDVIDCRYVKPALIQAKAANIPVIAVEGYDCSDTDPNEESLFAATVQYPMGNQQDYYKALYTAMAQYPIAKLDGNSKAAYLVDNVFQASISSVDTVKETYAPCTTCTLVVDAFPFEEFGNLKARAQSLILKNPDLNTLIPSYGDITTAGVAAAAEASGKDFIVNAGDSVSPAGVELVKEGKATYGYGFTAGWKGYALMDTVLRYFAGEPPVSSGMGVNLYDAEHNLDADGNYIQPFDYATLYKQAWGVN